MGAYLSCPNREKVSEDGAGLAITYGASSMQGWRVGMEDAHIAQPALCDRYGLFAVFDGHGGKEVAQFCSKHMPGEFAAMVKKCPAVNEQMLKELFHRMDALLRDDQYAEELALLSGRCTSEAAKGSPIPANGAKAPNAKDRAAQMVRTSLNASLDEAKKKGKLTKQEATELLVKMMALQRMEGKNGEGSAGGAASTPGGGAAASTDEDNSNTSAGCTANVMLVVGKELFIANAGDSRAVLCSKGKAIELSSDHKPNQPGEMDRIKSAGGWVTDGSTGHFRVNGNLNLSRSIGDLKYKNNVQMGRERQIITAEPDVRRHTLKPGDEFVVLACDGVYDVLSNQDLVDFVRARIGKVSKLSTICEEIFDRCIASDPKQTGGIGGDNMTCIIIKFA